MKVRNTEYIKLLLENIDGAVEKGKELALKNRSVEDKEAFAYGFSKAYISDLVKILKEELGLEG